MENIAQFRQTLFHAGPGQFESKALASFQFQASNNAIYRDFLHYLDIKTEMIRSIDHIPFLPIDIFKSKKIVTGNQNPELFFESSGTSGAYLSKHYIVDPTVYRDSIIKGFEIAYGNITDFCILALLPSYLERPNASLVYMCRTLMEETKHPNDGFYLHELEKLQSIILENEKAETKTILIGVSFALLDLAELISFPLKHTIILETGGMKGRRKEITREELHAKLKNAFQLKEIHSEYGMTELLSQAYSKGNGRFFSPPWMRISIRDPEDPLTLLPQGNTGCINIIDLANIHSCCFIATMDLGRIYQDGSFEVLGRYDNTDIRGCNLLFS